MTRTRKHRRLSSEVVLAELRNRAARGRSLASGANRGDWLYAAAVRLFGSWGEAVAAAGFDYEQVREVALSADEVLRRIRHAAEQGKKLRARDFTIEAAGARRHFGTWGAAVDAAGCELPSLRKWTPEKVVTQLREDQRRGLPLGSLAVIRRNEPLYGAARRCFGSWAAAIAAVAAAERKARRTHARRTR